MSTGRKISKHYSIEITERISLLSSPLADEFMGGTDKQPELDEDLPRGQYWIRVYANVCARQDY